MNKSKGHKPTRRIVPIRTPHSGPRWDLILLALLAGAGALAHTPPRG